MVRFEKDRFIIEVVTGSEPVQNWLSTVIELTNLLGDPIADTKDNRYWTNALLSEMMPEVHIAEKMIPNNE